MRTRSESQKCDKQIEAVKMFINKCDCRSEICNATCDVKKRILDENEDLCFDIIICINRLLGMCVLADEYNWCPLDMLHKFLRNFNDLTEDYAEDRIKSDY